MNPEGWRDGESTVRFKKETEFAISRNILDFQDTKKEY